MQNQNVKSKSKKKTKAERLQMSMVSPDFRISRISPDFGPDFGFPDLRGFADLLPDLTDFPDFPDFQISMVYSDFRLFRRCFFSARYN